eukprot:m.268384 g.268384  ORF g.268384 m.268384 type:complete len:629 (+) comp15657_c1_seq5:968-2854(+)
MIGIVLVCAFANTATGTQSFTFNKAPDPQNLTITIAVPTEKVLRMFNATFTDYLNRVVSPQFDNRVTFRCEAFTESALLTGAEFRHFQMYFGNPVTGMCLDSEFHAANLLNIRRKVLGKVVDHMGGVLFALRNETHPILHWNQARGMRIAADSFRSPAGFVVQRYELQVAATDPLNSAKKLIFLEDCRDIIKAVVNDDADLGMVPTGCLEQYYETLTGGSIVEDLTIVAQHYPVTPYGDKLPFVSSTSLIPEWMFGSMDDVPWDIRTAVVDALLAIDETSDEAVQGEYHSWMPITSQLLVQNILTHLQILTPSDDPTDPFNIASCPRTFDVYDGIACPHGYTTKSYEELLYSCEYEGRPCPENGVCLCETCKPACQPDATLSLEGRCFCNQGFMSFGSTCIRDWHFAIAATFTLCAVIGGLIFGVFLHMKSRADRLWHINPDDIKFDHPPEVLGAGSFGVVLKGEWHGAHVAVKRVVPQTHAARERFAKKIGGTGANMDMIDVLTGASTTGRYGSKGGTKNDIGFVFHAVEEARDSKGATTKSSQLSTMHNEFISEMRVLSKIRHPCITTIMGAVINKGCDLMMVMEYMELGSLYSILHNDTMVLEGDVLYEMVGCVQGHAPVVFKST